MKYPLNAFSLITHSIFDATNQDTIECVRRTTPSLHKWNSFFVCRKCSIFFTCFVSFCSSFWSFLFVFSSVFDITTIYCRQRVRDRIMTISFYFLLGQNRKGFFVFCLVPGQSNTIWLFNRNVCEFNACFFVYEKTENLRREKPEKHICISS